jgi:predicted  nucleic acid-binding Zn-ribbon protein
MEETARQFKKLEEDVQRVEKILEEKEQTIESNKRETE